MGNGLTPFRCAILTEMSRPVPPPAVGKPTHSQSEPSLEGAFSPEGVDLTVIRWMLARTPTERLQTVQDLLDAAWALRAADEA